MHSVIVMHRVLLKRDRCRPIDAPHDDDGDGDDPPYLKCPAGHILKKLISNTLYFNSHGLVGKQNPSFFFLAVEP